MDTTQQFIANDYDLVRGQSSFQIITGPNMVITRRLTSASSGILLTTVMFVLLSLIHI